MFYIYAKKTVGRDLTDLAHSSSYWSVLYRKLWRIGVCVARTRAHRNSALTVLFTDGNGSVLVIINVTFSLDNEIVYNLI